MAASSMYRQILSGKSNLLCKMSPFACFRASGADVEIFKIDFFLIYGLTLKTWIFHDFIPHSVHTSHNSHLFVSALISLFSSLRSDRRLWTDFYFSFLLIHFVSKHFKCKICALNFLVSLSLYTQLIRQINGLCV